MGKIRTQALATLDRLYRFAGGLGDPGAVDIESPVTVVHDVAPSAIARQSFAFTAQLTDVTAGGGARSFTNLSAQGIIDQAPAPRPSDMTADNTDVWLLDAHCLITAASASDLANVNLFAFPQYPAATALYGQMVRRWTVALGVLLESGGSRNPLYNASANPRDLDGLFSKLPMRVGLISMGSLDDGTGAIDVVANLRVLLVPKGTILTP